MPDWPDRDNARGKYHCGDKKFAVIPFVMLAIVWVLDRLDRQR